MQHIYKAIADLRRLIATDDQREQLQEIDSLLAVAQAELRRKLAAENSHDSRH